MITGASEHQLDTAELTEGAEAVRRVEFARKMAQPTGAVRSPLPSRDTRLRRRCLACNHSSLWSVYRLKVAFDDRRISERLKAFPLEVPPLLVAAKHSVDGIMCLGRIIAQIHKKARHLVHKPL